ncbi:tyrosine-type recombinase/integrase [Rhizobium wenxiniae]|uniref:tyrosine-type recombinase/integrase n=1 Tax=Rhizobium wenxiniae TaxID=1737357 RepID=UPI003C17037E
MSLTDMKCRNAKPAAKDYKLTDAGRLYLLVRATGSKLWRMNYSFGGKQKTLSIGAYPKVSLGDARQARENAKEQLAAGIDPALHGRPDPKQAVKAVAKDWFEARKVRWDPEYAARIWTRLEDRVFPYIGEMSVSNVEPDQVLTLLRAIEAEKKFDLARRIRQYISGIFRFAVASGFIKHDPSATLVDAMESKPKTVRRSALREDELSEFFGRLQAEKGSEPQTLLALEFVVHTFVRTKELRFAKWEEFDLRRKTWRIPEERMKMKKEHIVPLTDHAIGILRKLKEIAGKSEWVVPSAEQGTAVISENTMLYCLYRLGYHSRATIHGFRGTASTILNESGLWREDAIERQLAHVEEDEVRDSYNAALYLDERTRMMNWYSDFLLRKAKERPLSRDELLEGLL